MSDACQFTELAAVARCTDDDFCREPHVWNTHLHELCSNFRNIFLSTQVYGYINAISDESLPLLVGIAPYLKNNMKDITEIVKEKYAQAINKDKEEIEVVE